MTHSDIVFSALAHWRNRGASLKDIRTFAGSREAKAGSSARDERSLRDLATQELTYQVGERWFLTSAGYKLAKGHAVPGTWEAGDALILLPILMGSEPCTLDQLISTVDYLNHGIPSLEETHGALNRGVATKLVRVRRAVFTATETASEIFAKVCPQSGNVMGTSPGALAKILECPHCGVQPKKVRFRLHVDQAAFDRAIKSYRAGFASSRA